ncbi:unnamed protein product [Somion occarium]|uniref:EXS domain-containing protein n=1 Tax=Somion occarium TaxID=3059160 RepID=A0ABP1DHL9_9APHY
MNHDIVSDETTFSTIFPLPYRVLALASLGVLAWATNLHGLELLGIDAANALDLDTPRSRATHSSLRSASPLPTISHRGWKHASHSDPQHTPVYKLFLQYSVIVLVSWSLYRSTTRGDLVLVDVFKYIPAVTVLVVLILLICPFNVFQKHERDRFFAAIHRCLFSSKKQRIYFSDVVFADIFTSFAKVFGDVWLSLYMLLPGGSLLSQPSQDGWARWILPTLMSLPYAVRFRQCIIEYVSSTNESRRPLYNALKYASSFPATWLSTGYGTGTISYTACGYLLRQ